MNRIINYILIVIFISLSFSADKNYRLTPDQNKRLQKAKSLNNNGLFDQAKTIYMDLFNEYPYEKPIS